MEIVEKAIIFAAKAHGNQKRKGTDIPYITHPFAVGMLLQKEKCSEEVIAAGILHDTLEDTETTFEDLTEVFGVHVANLVLPHLKRTNPCHGKSENNIRLTC